VALFVLQKYNTAQLLINGETMMNKADTAYPSEKDHLYPEEYNALTGKCYRALTQPWEGTENCFRGLFTSIQI
jgi:hypothetical protein